VLLVGVRRCRLRFHHGKANQGRECATFTTRRLLPLLLLLVVGAPEERRAHGRGGRLALGDLLYGGAGLLVGQSQLQVGRLGPAGEPGAADRRTAGSRTADSKVLLVFAVFSPLEVIKLHIN